VSLDTSDLPAFATVEEVAALLRISRSSAYEAIKRGEIPTVSFGRRLRVPRSTLLRLAGEQTVSVTAEQAADLRDRGGTTGPATEAL
jgi:excisionase family DNA binding protein